MDMEGLRRTYTPARRKPSQRSLLTKTHTLTQRFTRRRTEETDPCRDDESVSYQIEDDMLKGNKDGSY
jgi:hypothetical protein